MGLAPFLVQSLMSPSVCMFCSGCLFRKAGFPALAAIIQKLFSCNSGLVDKQAWHSQQINVLFKPPDKEFEEADEIFVDGGNSVPIVSWNLFTKSVLSKYYDIIRYVPGGEEPARSVLVLTLCLWEEN